MMSEDTRRSRLQTLSRSLTLLEQFTLDEPEWKLVDLARQLDLDKAIVLRILTTFEDHNWLVKKDGRYSLGPAVLRFVSIVLNKIDLRKIARPIMEKLAEETGETVFLTVASAGYSVCIEKVDSNQQVRLIMDIGGHYPLHSGASNKVLLAFLPEDEQQRILSGQLESFTERTTTDPQLLRKQLQRIREDGWAITTGESTPHATSISVPVRNTAGEVIAALSVAGPENRLTDTTRTVRLLQRAAEEIGKNFWSTADSAASNY